MGLSNRDKMSTSLSGDARGIFCQSLKLIHPAVWEEMRNRYTDTQTEGARSHNKNIDFRYCQEKNNKINTMCESR